MLRRHSGRILLLSVIGLALIGNSCSASEASNSGRPQSIILVVGDGMGMGQYTLARYFGESFPLTRFDHVGLMTTHPLHDKIITDSGAAATAMSTGHKAHTAVLGMDADENPVETALEVAESMGKVSGVVTTAAITDATPAAFAAHYPNRSNHPEIARQMTSAGIEVLLGGGRKNFQLDANGNDLIESLIAGGTQVIYDLEAVLDPAKPLLGLFAPGEMPVPPERAPTLLEMTMVALDRLKDHPDGFFLLVEDEGTDTQSHRNNTEAVIAALNDLMSTMQYLLDFQAANPEVLLIFTGDHETGGLFWDQNRHDPGILKWTTGVHTGNPIPIFASGPGSEVFDSFIDNTDVGKTLIRYLREKN